MYHARRMKRLSAVLAAVLFLASCGGGSSTSATACAQQFWNGTIGMCLTTGWNIVDRETLTQRGVPDEVIAAFQADKAVAGQFPTITVTRENLQTKTDSTSYSKASIRSVGTLPGYKLIDTRDMKVDGQTVQMHVFTAQPLAEEPERRFYQVSAVSGNTGYTFTALTPLSVSDALEKQIKTMLQAVTFIDPTGKQASSK